MSRVLTKSRFQLGRECATKLFYTGKTEYVNNKKEDAFLAALADGGFQVGALARQYFADGIEISTYDAWIAVNETKRWMKQDEVVLFEPAFLADGLLVRCDILVKKGNKIELIEVKAKSFESGKNCLIGKSGRLTLEWSDYVWDLAYQKHVLSLALPDHVIDVSLMMVDKTALCPVDGLNQMFLVAEDEYKRKRVKVSPSFSQEHLHPSMLVRVEANAACQIVLDGQVNLLDDRLSFLEYVQKLSDAYVKDIRIQCPPSVACGLCEFTASKAEMEQGLKNGRQECWEKTLGFSSNDFGDPTILEIWNYRGKKRLLAAGKIKQSSLVLDDINPQDDGSPGLSTSQRQWMQIEKSQKKDTSPYVDRKHLSDRMKEWIFPLHFIDFETSMPALPFTKGRRPYEGIAFQFSHHIVDKDGNVKHAGEFLSAKPGVFPNFDFVRALKKELARDRGTIFRYAAHENTYLNLIRQQLLETDYPLEDRAELIEFIEDITVSTAKSDQQWFGSRAMVDMLELVKRFYYHPLMRGSNSIKQVLPAILSSSSYLQEKYSKPCYGSDQGIFSHNFRDWTWVRLDEQGCVIDPYRLLPQLFQDETEEEHELLSRVKELSDGGAALTAYARLQYVEMTAYERSELENALLKYCELDTLAMVMVYEGWKEMTESASS